MSDDLLQQPIQALEANPLLEQAEPIESGTEVREEHLEAAAAGHEAAVTTEAEKNERGRFDDASDDFAYEAEGEIADELNADDEAEEMSDFADVPDDDLSGGDNDPVPQPKRDHSKHAAQFEPQRLAKILAAAGIDARRKCEEYVTAGRVSVDGQVITDLAFRADPFLQKIDLDGEKVKLQRKVYFVLNKPRGVVCTNHDPAGRPRIIDLFPQFKERLFSIGRLDAESEGLILVTNDGELANRMAHPRYRVPKFYLCHVKGVPSTETLAALKRGMYFEEGRFSVEGVRMKKTAGNSAFLDIVLNEGQNREIRRLLAKVDHKVMRLKRVGFGPIRLGDLPSGAFRPLTTEESKLLKELSEQRAHLDKPVSRGRNKKPRGGKPPYGSKPSFGSKPAHGRSAPAYGKPTYGAKPEFPAKRSYGDKVRSRQVSAQRDDEIINVADEDSMPIGRGPRRPAGGYRPREYSQGGGYGQRPQHRLVQATENDDAVSPQGEFTSERRYGNRPPQGGYNQRQQTGTGRPPRRYQSNETNSSHQTQSSDSDSDFNGGRRRVYDQQQEAEYTPRPQRQGRPPQQEGTYTPRPPRGQGRPPQVRPPQRRYGSQEGNSRGDSGQRRYGSQAGSTGERSGGYSNQRRPTGNRGDSQSGPPRSRGQRPARPPRPTTADGKEILEGKVTGYRTPPKEGLPRRPYKAVAGMKVNREQRQQRRKKSDG